jgi:hypothetical protein
MNELLQNFIVLVKLVKIESIVYDNSFWKERVEMFKMNYKGRQDLAL